MICARVHLLLLITIDTVTCCLALLCIAQRMSRLNVRKSIVLPGFYKVNKTISQLLGYGVLLCGGSVKWPAHE